MVVVVSRILSPGWPNKSSVFSSCVCVCVLNLHVEMFYPCTFLEFSFSPDTNLWMY